MTAYRLRPPLLPRQRLVALVAVLADIALAIKGNDVLTAHDTDPRLDVDIEIDARGRLRLLLCGNRGL